MISNEKVKEIQSEFPSHLWLKLKTYHKDTYEHICDEYSGDSFSEKAYQYVYGKGERFCSLNDCKNECSFQNFGDGFTKYCSYECSGVAKENKVNNTCKICGKQFTTLGSRSRDFCSKKCRVKYQNTKEWKEKMRSSYKETIKNKYGKKHYSKTDSFKEDF